MGRGEDSARQLSFRTDAQRVIAAEVHAFRHAPPTWPRLVAKVRELGATHVTLLAPWSEHEAREGERDFGSQRAALAIGSFLDRAEEVGLRAIVRIGPRVRADLTFAGLPEHVVYDREVMARSARGNSVPSPMPPRVFPWPSYSSTAYRDRITAYFAALAVELAPRLAPQGIVDVVDVEDAGAVLLRAGAYARDYHPDAIRAFRSELEARYATPAALSAAWGVRVASFADVSAPTRFAADTPRDLPRHLDWARFQEASVRDFRVFLRDTLAAVGLGAATLSATLDSNAVGMPTDPHAAANVLGRAGVELAARADEVDAVRRRTTPLALASERPFARVIVGGSPWGRSRCDDDTFASILLAVAFGARELELSMGVEHERWWGAPIASDGEPAATFEPTRKLLAALAELGIEKLAFRPDAVIVVPPEYVRLTRVTHLFGPLGAGILDFVGRSFAEATLEGRFGFEKPIQHVLFARLRELEAALDDARLSFALVDPASLAAMETVPAIVLSPTFDFVDDATASALESASSRGAAVLTGPLDPRLDGAMDPRASSGALQASLASELAARIDDTVAQRGLTRLPSGDEGARAYPLATAREVLAYVVANPSCTDDRIAVDVDAHDPLTDETYAAGTPIPVARGRVRLLVRSEGESASGTRSSARPSARPRARRSR